MILRQTGCFRLLLSGLLAVAGPVFADLESTGVTALRAREPALTGAGMVVAHVEAAGNGGQDGIYQTDPAAVGQPHGKFSFFETASPFPTATGYSILKRSDHATDIGNIFYGDPAGVAPGVAEIRCFDALYFVYTLIPAENPSDIGAAVVNQSFYENFENDATDMPYDHYADLNKILFVNGVLNDSNDRLPSPATMFNGIAVGLAADLPSSAGPTVTGRSKPDLVVSAVNTSGATAWVSGAAALLIQAATRGDGGDGTEEHAADPRTIKALLLNGATKPAGWATIGMEPLDRKLGTGMLNVNHSHLQLAGGKQEPATDIARLTGWNFKEITNGEEDTADQYVFELPAAKSPAYHLTATLTWHRQHGESDINDMDLVLYNADTGVQVTASMSPVNNVEHLFQTELPPGRYDLRVIKRASAAVTAMETYALAFEFRTNLQLWRDLHFATIANAGSAADFADFDGDSLPNLLEYALGTNPVVADAPGSLLQVGSHSEANESYLTLSIHRMHRRTDVVYQVEAGEAPGDLSGDVTVLEDTETLLKVGDNTPFSEASRRFMQLRVMNP